MQKGGGKCSLCGSNNTSMKTCPLNKNAIHPNKTKHPLAIKDTKVSPIVLNKKKKESEKQTLKESEKQTLKESEKQTSKESEKQTSKESEKQTSKESEKQTSKDIQQIINKLRKLTFNEQSVIKHRYQQLQQEEQVNLSFPLTKIRKPLIKRYTLDDFNIKQATTDKSGTFGEIVSATFKDSTKRVVLKKNKRTTTMTEDNVKELFYLNHLNQYPDTKTVYLYGYILPTITTPFYLVLENLDYDLHSISISKKHTSSKGRLSNSNYKIIFYQMIKAYYTLHTLGFIHNDIKLNNLMISKNEIRIIDLGLSYYLGTIPLKTIIDSILTTSIVAGPEYTKNKSKINYTSDVFAIANTLIHLIIRDYIKMIGLPNNRIVNVNVGLPDLDYTDYIKDKLGNDGTTLLHMMLHNDPLERPCLNELLQNSYFDDVRDKKIELTGGATKFPNYYGLLTNKEEKNYLVKNICYQYEQFENYKDMMFPSIKNKYLDAFKKIIINWNETFTIDVNVITNIICMLRILNVYENEINKPQKILTISRFVYIIYKYVFDYVSSDYEFDLAFYFKRFDVPFTFLPVTFLMNYVYIQLNFNKSSYIILAYKQLFKYLINDGNINLPIWIICLFCLKYSYNIYHDISNNFNELVLFYFDIDFTTLHTYYKKFKTIIEK
jgi:serine/threonine protein kinase